MGLHGFISIYTGQIDFSTEESYAQEHGKCNGSRDYKVVYRDYTLT